MTDNMNAWNNAIDGIDFSNVIESHDHRVSCSTVHPILEEILETLAGNDEMLNTALPLLEQQIGSCCREVLGRVAGAALQKATTEDPDGWDITSDQPVIFLLDYEELKQVIYMAATFAMLSRPIVLEKLTKK